MDEGLKKRLIGAAVLAALAVIFVPMLFEEPPPPEPELAPLPPRPPVNDFASEMLREEVPAVMPLAPRPVEPEQPQAAEEPAAEQTRTGLSAWVVQAASLSSRENADKLVGRLRESGLPTPDPELVDIRGKRYYRVRVGPVVERSRAEAMVARVSEIAGTQAQVQRYP
jgi:DedD protein